MTGRSGAPAVTVLLAVYNGERYLTEAIDSVLAQTYDDFELLIVDDGSTDGTPALLTGYTDSRVRVLRNERNLGLPSSLNRGLREARGALVARHDADDASAPTRLGRQTEFLRAHPDVALVGSWYREVDADGVASHRVRLPTDDLRLRWAMLFFCPFVHSAVMFRKAAVPGVVGGYDESLAYSQDYELWTRVAARFRVANLPEFLLRLRLNPWSMTETLGDRTLEGVRLRIAAVARLLQWDESGPGVEDAFGAIRALAMPSDGLRPVAAVERANEELLQLHKAFCVHEKLDQAICAAHEREVRARACDRLHDMAFEHLSRNSEDSTRRLLACARRLLPRTVLTPRHLGMYMRLMARRDAGRAAT